MINIATISPNKANVSVNKILPRFLPYFLLIRENISDKINTGNEYAPKLINTKIYKPTRLGWSGSVGVLNSIKKSTNDTQNKNAKTNNATRKIMLITNKAVCFFVIDLTSLRIYT